MKALARPLLNRLLTLAGPQNWPSRRPRLWVLMYHRVIPRELAMEQCEEPGMYVTPESFEKHIIWLKDFATFMALSEWVNRPDSNEAPPRRSVVITFDDGWRDNYTHAFPILKRHNVPATIFVVSGMVDTLRAFWPNRLSRLIDDRKNDPEWGADLHWLAEISPLKPADIHSTEDVSRVIQCCKQLPDNIINKHLDAVCSTNDSGLERTMLSWKEIQEMKDSGLVEFGSHTVNHVRLNEKVSAEVIDEEILSSKHELGTRLQKDIELFCYPNGDTSPAAEQTVRSNFRAAVTTVRGVNRLGIDNPHQLMRIGMHEDISNTRQAFYARLSGLI